VAGAMDLNEEEGRCVLGLDVGNTHGDAFLLTGPGDGIPHAICNAGGMSVKLDMLRMKLRSGDYLPEDPNEQALLYRITDLKAQYGLGKSVQIPSGVNWRQLLKKHWKDNKDFLCKITQVFDDPKMEDSDRVHGVLNLLKSTWEDGDLNVVCGFFNPKDDGADDVSIDMATCCWEGALKYKQVFAMALAPLIQQVKDWCENNICHVHCIVVCHPVFWSTDRVRDWTSIIEEVFREALKRGEDLKVKPCDEATALFHGWLFGLMKVQRDALIPSTRQSVSLVFVLDTGSSSCDGVLFEMASCNSLAPHVLTTFHLGVYGNLFNESLRRFLMKMQCNEFATVTGHDRICFLSDDGVEAYKLQLLTATGNTCYLPRDAHRNQLVLKPEALDALRVRGLNSASYVGKLTDQNLCRDAINLLTSTFFEMYDGAHMELTNILRDVLGKHQGAKVMLSVVLFGKASGMVLSNSSTDIKCVSDVFRRDIRQLVHEVSHMNPQLSCKLKFHSIEDPQHVVDRGAASIACKLLKPVPQLVGGATGGNNRLTADVLYSFEAAANLQTKVCMVWKNGDIIHELPVVRVLDNQHIEYSAAAADNGDQLYFTFMFGDFSKLRDYRDSRDLQDAESDGKYEQVRVSLGPVRELPKGVTDMSPEAQAIGICITKEHKLMVLVLKKFQTQGGHPKRQKTASSMPSNNAGFQILAVGCASKDDETYKRLQQTLNKSAAGALLLQVRCGNLVAGGKWRRCGTVHCPVKGNVRDMLCPSCRKKMSNMSVLPSLYLQSHSGSD